MGNQAIKSIALRVAAASQTAGERVVIHPPRQGRSQLIAEEWVITLYSTGWHIVSGDLTPGLKAALRILIDEDGT